MKHLFQHYAKTWHHPELVLFDQVNCLYHFLIESNSSFISFLIIYVMCYYIGLVMDVMFWRSTISYIHCFHIHWLYVLHCIWTTVLYCKTCNIILVKTIWVCMLFESTCLIQVQVENPLTDKRKALGCPVLAIQEPIIPLKMVVIIQAIYQQPFFFFLNAGCQQPIFMHIYCTGYIRPSSVFILFVRCIHWLSSRSRRRCVWA